MEGGRHDQGFHPDRRRRRWRPRRSSSSCSLPRVARRAHPRTQLWQSCSTSSPCRGCASSPSVSTWITGTGRVEGPLLGARPFRAAGRLCAQPSRGRTPRSSSSVVASRRSGVTPRERSPPSPRVRLAKQMQSDHRKFDSRLTQTAQNAERGSRARTTIRRSRTRRRRARSSSRRPGRTLTRRSSLPSGRHREMAISRDRTMGLVHHAKSPVDSSPPTGRAAAATARRATIVRGQRPVRRCRS